MEKKTFALSTLFLNKFSKKKFVVVWWELSQNNKPRELYWIFNSILVIGLNVRFNLEKFNSSYYSQALLSVWIFLIKSLAFFSINIRRTTMIMRRRLNKIIFYVVAKLSIIAKNIDFAKNWQNAIDTHRFVWSFYYYL
jgi:hypothetical protein